MTQFIISPNMDSEIGKRIELILKRKHLTQDKFAQALSTQRPTVNKWIGGHITPSYELLYKIKSEFPEIDCNWLITGDGSMLGEKKGLNVLNENSEEYSTAWQELVKTKESIIKDKDIEIKFLREMLSKK